VGKVGRNRDLSLSQFTKAALDDDRIWIPPDLSELGHLAGTESFDCWLVMVVVGRYRLAPKAALAPEETRTLLRVLELSQPSGDSVSLFSVPESNERALLPARVMSVEAHPKDDGWRIKLPKELKLLLPKGEDDSFLFLVPVSGLIELWIPGTVRDALSVPITRLLDLW